MQTDQNGHQLQYITLGNNNIPTSTGSTPTNDSKGGNNNSGPKTWTPSDMEAALDALRTHNMSLTKASATYGIPSTTLWQRAHRLGIGKFAICIRFILRIIPIVLTLKFLRKQTHRKRRDLLRRGMRIHLIVHSMH